MVSPYIDNILSLMVSVHVLYFIHRVAIYFNVLNMCVKNRDTVKMHKHKIIKPPQFKHLAMVDNIICTSLSYIYIIGIFLEAFYVCIIKELVSCP